MPGARYPTARMSPGPSDSPTALPLATPPLDDNVEDGMTLILLRRARQGDKQARGDLFRRELPWIRKLVHARLHGAVRLMHETGDIVGNLALQVLQRAPHFEVASRVLFQQILALMTINHLKSQAKALCSRALPAGATLVVLDLDHGVAATTVSPPDAAARAEECAWCGLAVEFLTLRDQDVIHLRLFEDLEFPAIGTALGMTPDQARMRYHRARTSLMATVERLKARELPALLERSSVPKLRAFGA